MSSKTRFTILRKNPNRKTFSRGFNLSNSKKSSKINKNFTRALTANVLMNIKRHILILCRRGTRKGISGWRKWNKSRKCKTKNRGSSSGPVSSSKSHRKSTKKENAKSTSRLRKNGTGYCLTRKRLRATLCLKSIRIKRISCLSLWRSLRWAGMDSIVRKCWKMEKWSWKGLIWRMQGRWDWIICKKLKRK